MREMKVSAKGHILARGRHQAEGAALMSGQARGGGPEALPCQCARPAPLSQASQASWFSGKEVVPKQRWLPLQCPRLLIQCHFSIITVYWGAIPTC